MKKLSREGRFESGIDELVIGKVWAFVPVLSDGKYGQFQLGAAVANEPGYYPIPPFWAHGDDYAEMSEHAKELNAEMGLDADAAERIHISSMRPGKVRPPEPLGRERMIENLKEVRIAIRQVNEAAGETVFNPAATDCVNEMLRDQLGEAEADQFISNVKEGIFQ